MKKPVIGITLDSEPPGGYSKLPWYALRENYVGAVRRAGQGVLTKADFDYLLSPSGG